MPPYNQYNKEVGNNHQKLNNNNNSNKNNNRNRNTNKKHNNYNKNGGGNNNKSAIPSGISVQELKQMTAMRMAGQHVTINTTSNENNDTSNDKNTSSPSGVTAVTSCSDNKTTASSSNTGSSAHKKNNKPLKSTGGQNNYNKPLSNISNNNSNHQQQRRSSYSSTTSQNGNSRRSSLDRSSNSIGVSNSSNATVALTYQQQFVQHKDKKSNSNNKNKNRNNNNNNNNKMPHGLTVQELKELTRIRLAKEAMEEWNKKGANNDENFNTPSFINNDDENSNQGDDASRMVAASFLGTLSANSNVFVPSNYFSNSAPPSTKHNNLSISHFDENGSNKSTPTAKSNSRKPKISIKANDLDEESINQQFTTMNLSPTNYYTHQQQLNHHNLQNYPCLQNFTMSPLRRPLSPKSPGGEINEDLGMSMAEFLLMTPSSPARFKGGLCSPTSPTQFRFGSRSNSFVNHFAGSPRLHNLSPRRSPRLNGSPRSPRNFSFQNNNYSYSNNTYRSRNHSGENMKVQSKFNFEDNNMPLMTPDVMTLSQDATKWQAFNFDQFVPPQPPKPARSSGHTVKKDLSVTNSDDGLDSSSTSTVLDFAVTDGLSPTSVNTNLSASNNDYGNKVNNHQYAGLSPGKEHQPLYNDTSNDFFPQHVITKES